MASTFRSAVRSSSRRGVSLTRSFSVASKRNFSTGEAYQASRSQKIEPQRTNQFTSSSIRQASTAANSYGAQKPAETEQEELDRIDIPVFQFKDILADGVLPPTKTLKLNVDGKSFSFDNVFLRDSCTCPTCVDPDTQQKLFTTSDINLDIYPRRARVANGRLKIEWSHQLERSAVPEANVDGRHWSYYEPEFLANSMSNIKSVKTTMSDWRRITWDRSIMERDVMWVNYKDYMEDDLALAKALKHLSLYGLLFIRGVPDGRTVDQMPSLAERIGNLKRTFYGDTWTVKSVPNSKNIALDLGLHMDLLYFESPPGLQFLHCVENSVTGGESYFTDAFRAANILRQSSPIVFDLLTRYPVNFHYHNDSRHYRFSRPIIVMKPQNETYHPEGGIDHINWAPPFQAPFTMDHSGQMVSKSAQWRSFLKGMADLNKLFESPQNQYELLLKEGDCVVFFNRRVLHARRAFDAQSGNRRLTGGYIDIDAFESACRVLAERYPETDARKAEEPGYEYLANARFGSHQWT
ncbi:hypothetical protein ABW19_dt0210183 [Dactylella cylindrospora]|nr:hypothetical protein ABW19_dt0210183 [Dactylella cylindrospora]